eukprot:TRINITY_DN1947_c0_g1_i1.p1 TRINITY_DN1947_c0_g1~~TRINITY_DN1947_c0_g1_i1.p1  ORF type:complete len:426 (+),score=128.83 TRINITY_DN1947_c0_g1_i1:218-1495(+)
MSSSVWRFSQLFGEKSEEVSEVDIVSAIEFDSTGDYIAVGDRGGRIVVFEKSILDDRIEYKFYAEFQSHEPEFDYLKSLEIEEKINKIKWCKRNSAQFLLTTNDKTVKLWKLYEKQLKQLSIGGGGNELSIPSVVNSDSMVVATPRRVFSNAHAYHINSISLNSDHETYISADDLRINLWNLEISDQSFNIVDIKPANMEELTEVITSAEFHPVHCNYFMYSSSKGTIKLGDLRNSALCDEHAKIFEEEEDPSNKSFFSEIISSISDCKFSSDGNYILSRDYLTLKVWDIKMENKPLKTIQIHDHLRSKLCDLYENDCIFDKFECNFNHDGTKIMTGSYNNMFYIYDWENDITTSIEADKNCPANKINTTAGKPKKIPNSENIDYSKKCLHVAPHPNEDFIAIGANNNLFLFDTGPSNDYEIDSD